MGKQKTTTLGQSRGKKCSKTVREQASGQKTRKKVNMFFF